MSKNSSINNHDSSRPSQSSAGLVSKLFAPRPRPEASAAGPQDNHTTNNKYHSSTTLTEPQTPSLSTTTTTQPHHVKFMSMLSSFDSLKITQDVGATVGSILPSPAKGGATLVTQARPHRIAQSKLLPRNGERKSDRASYGPSTDPFFFF